MNKVRISYKRIITNRILITALLLIMQIAWFILSVFVLSDYSSVINVLLKLLSLTVVMFIVGKEDNPSYKIIWIILIMAVPILGGFLYLFAGDKKPTKRMHRQISESRLFLLPQLKRNDTVMESLCEKDSRSAACFEYVRRQSGYPCYDNTEAYYYDCGEKMFEAMKRELKKAEKYIFIEYFIIKSGHMWSEIMNILVSKAQEGVDIRIIYDDMGCVALLPPKYFKKLERLSPNIKCLAFNPVVPVLSLVMNNRDHRKLMIIDGKVVFNGGINLSDEYINLSSPYGYWKDTGVMLRGEAVINMTEMFLEIWHTFKGTEDEALGRFVPCEMNEPQSRCGYVQPFYDTPLDNEALSENLYIDIVNRAEKYVYIFTPYLILDDMMKGALCLAAKRGVDVRIVTPGIPDKKPIYRLTRANYSPLLRAGVRIFEYTPGFIHAKSFVSDDSIAVVGTINLDYRSLFLHFECGVLMYGCDAVRELYEDCVDTMEKSREITLCNIKEYYRGTMFDAILRILAPML